MAWVQSSKESHLKSNRKRKAWLDTYKAERGCARCGIKDPVVLVAHHRNPEEKERPISDWWRIGFEPLIEELKKCDILCYNCHAIVEEERRRGRAANE